MKTYLQYIKEGSEEFYKEILELYEKMPPKKGDPSTITAEEIIDFLKRYIDKEFKISIFNHASKSFTLDLYGRGNGVSILYHISFDVIRHPGNDNTLVIPFELVYYFDKKYNPHIFIYSDGNSAKKLVRIVQIKYDKYKEFLQILREYFENHPECTKQFPIEKLFPDFNPEILKQNEWS